MVDAQSFNDRDPIDPGCRIYYVFQTADRQALSEALGITASTRMMSYEMTRRYKTHQGFLENNTDVFV